MKVLINGVVYDSTKIPIVLHFDDNERDMFGGLRRFVSAPEDSTVEERQRLIDTPIDEINDCPHINVDRWNHGYHSRCRDCGEEDV